MARTVIYCDLDRPDAVIDEIVAACSGDMISAVKALLLVNETLESELQQLRAGAAYRAQTSGEMFAALRLSQQAQFDLRDPPARLINAAAMPRWAHGLSCMHARPTDTRPRHGQLRDRPHALQVLSGERQQGRCVGLEAAH
jgi:hypothetical protein